MLYEVIVLRKWGLSLLSKIEQEWPSTLFTFSLHCRELLLDFYQTSQQRKPQQIIIFRCVLS
jgi:hypothetical protein